jgi:hypothetical protein
MPNKQTMMASESEQAAPEEATQSSDLLCRGQGEKKPCSITQSQA